MNQTTNYQLSQWESTDRILMSDFNSDNAKLDEALKSHDDELAALEANLEEKGNCAVLVTTYNGSGAYGEDRPTSVTFPNGEPDLVVVMDTEGRNYIILKGATSAVNENYRVNVTWSAAGVSWYSTQNSSGQMSSGLHYVFFVYLRE